VNARRRAMMTKLSEKHAVEMTEELSKQQQERDALNEKRTKEIEKIILKDNLEVKLTRTLIITCNIITELYNTIQNNTILYFIA